MREVFLTLLWIIFITDSILLVLIVLLQSGRGGGLSGMLGGGGMAESALGPKSGLPRITGIMAAIFFGAAILIAGLTRQRRAMDPLKTKDVGTAVEEPGPPEDKGAPETKEGMPKAAAPKSSTQPKASTATPPAVKTTTTTAPKASTATAPEAATATTPKAPPSTSPAPGKTP